MGRLSLRLRPGPKVWRRRPDGSARINSSCYYYARSTISWCCSCYSRRGLSYCIYPRYKILVSRLTLVWLSVGLFCLRYSEAYLSKHSHTRSSDDLSSPVSCMNRGSSHNVLGLENRRTRSGRDRLANSYLSHRALYRARWFCSSRSTLTWARRRKYRVDSPDP